MLGLIENGEKILCKCLYTVNQSSIQAGSSNNMHVILIFLGKEHVHQPALTHKLH